MSIQKVIDEIDEWYTAYTEAETEEQEDRMNKAEGYISDLVITNWPELRDAALGAPA